jgi:hypothetical protein
MNQAETGFNECVHILTVEIEALDRITSLQKQVRSAAQVRDWDGVEACNDALGDIGTEFEKLEARRLVFFSMLSGTTTSGDGGEVTAWDFTLFAMRFPQEERRRLLELYRLLRARAFSIRCANDAMTRYFAEMRTTAEAILDAAFPERRGSLYTRSGRRAGANLGGLVLNQRF